MLSLHCPTIAFFLPSQLPPDSQNIGLFLKMLTWCPGLCPKFTIIHNLLSLDAWPSPAKIGQCNIVTSSHHTPWEPSSLHQYSKKEQNSFQALFHIPRWPKWQMLSTCLKRWEAPQSCPFKGVWLHHSPDDAFQSPALWEFLLPLVALDSGCWELGTRGSLVGLPDWWQTHLDRGNLGSSLGP